MASPHGVPTADSDGSDPESQRSFLRNASKKATEYHAQIPYLRKLPFPVIAIIVTLIIVNLLVWAAVGIVLVRKRRRQKKEHMLTSRSTGTRLSFQQRSCHIPWDCAMPWMQITSRLSIS